MELAREAFAGTELDSWARLNLFETDGFPVSVSEGEPSAGSRRAPSGSARRTRSPTATAGAWLYRCPVSVDLHCVECGREPRRDERFRAYLSIDHEVAVYCPGCAGQEFDDFED